MHKYLTVYKNSLSSFLQYRLNLGLLVISHIVSLTGIIYLWIAIYGAGQTIGNYSLQEIIFYYIVLTIVQTIIAEGVGMGFEISEDINKGAITNYLLKPFSYSAEQFCKLLGKGTINAFFMAPIIFILVLVFRHIAHIPPVLIWLEFIGMMALGLVFYFLIYYLGSLASFWLTYGKSAIFGILVISNLLNGALMPLDAFPAWFQHINTYSPFQFLIFLPIQTFLGRVHNWDTIFISALCWIAFFVLAILCVWKLGIRKYESIGR